MIKVLVRLSIEDQRGLKRVVEDAAVTPLFR